MVVFKMRDSVSSVRYFPVCNVLHLWRIWLIPTYTVCRLYDIKTEKTFKNEQRSKDVAAKKRPTTSGVGKINNYYEDIYIPP